MRKMVAFLFFRHQIVITLPLSSPQLPGKIIHLTSLLPTSVGGYNMQIGGGRQEVRGVESFLWSSLCSENLLASSQQINWMSPVFPFQG